MELMTCHFRKSNTLKHCELVQKQFKLLWISLLFVEMVVTWMSTCHCRKVTRLTVYMQYCWDSVTRMSTWFLLHVCRHDFFYTYVDMISVTRMSTCNCTKSYLWQCLSCLLSLLLCRRVVVEIQISKQWRTQYEVSVGLLPRDLSSLFCIRVDVVFRTVRRNMTSIRVIIIIVTSTIHINTERVTNCNSYIHHTD